MQTMREDAETILREAVAAAQPGRLVREALAAERLTGRIVLLAAGKAAWAMAQAACAAIDSLDISDIIGSLAGDDTIFIVMSTENDAMDFVKKLSKSISR